MNWDAIGVIGETVGAIAVVATKNQSHGMGIGVLQPLADMDSGDPAVVARRGEDLGLASYWVPEHAVGRKPLGGYRNKMGV